MTEAYEEQCERVGRLLAQFEPVYDRLDAVTDTAEETIQTEDVTFGEFGELAESEKRDLRRHLDQAAESLRSAERVARIYLSALHSTLNRFAITQPPEAAEVPPCSAP
ncbi:MAG TPA: hypothetical protein VJT49_27400 [Amycolatopsis sp.]|uniref:hypothetical protein n=1 Tax=Amycolatopsis sp. TaxID=37632 RepID=UPI002B475A97|nr:hypothetical protein [Amycolatopsis sp.]HKS48768.1 hypothetical protein [Amycolatopsis sp.]